MLRRRRPEPDPLAHVRPADVPARWHAAVEVAVEHRHRFREVRDLVAAGPLHDRIASLGDRVDAGVLAVWDLVQRAVVAERVLQTIEPEVAMDRLKDARRRLAAAEAAAEAAGGDTSDLRRDVELHAGRHAAAQRVWNEVEDLGNRLGALDARLGVVVAHAAELAAGAGQDARLDLAVADLDTAIDQLAATRAALAELDQ